MAKKNTKKKRKQYVRHNQNVSLNQGRCGWFARCFWVNCSFNFVRSRLSFGPRRGKTFGLGFKKNMKWEKLNCLVNAEWNTLHGKLDNKQNEAHRNTLVKSFHSRLWFGWNKSSVHKSEHVKTFRPYTPRFNRLSGLHVGMYVLIYGMYWSEWTAVPDTNIQPVNTEPHLAAEQSDIYIFLSSSWRSKTERH